MQYLQSKATEQHPPASFEGTGLLRLERFACNYYLVNDSSLGECASQGKNGGATSCAGHAEAVEQHARRDYALETEVTLVVDRNDCLAHMPLVSDSMLSARNAAQVDTLGDMQRTHNSATFKCSHLWQTYASKAPLYKK